MAKNILITINGSFTVEQFEKVMLEVRKYANGVYCDLTTIDEVSYVDDQMTVKIEYDRTDELYFGVKSISVSRNGGH